MEVTGFTPGVPLVYSEVWSTTFPRTPASAHFWLDTDLWLDFTNATLEKPRSVGLNGRMVSALSLWHTTRTGFVVYGAGTNLKVGAPVQREALKNFFLVVPLHFLA